ncbi:DMT family transporter [Burkholderiaceae bacterium DAT-1]|nr:DMT family transporter [Burkholderiaceae bacterium DAT-1]
MSTSTVFAKSEGHWFEDGRILAMLSAAGFSLKSIFIKLAYAGGQVDAISLLAIRMSISLPAFIWLARAGTRTNPLTRREWLALALLGLFGYYLSSLFDFMGLLYISAGLERLILFTYPSLVVLMEAVLHRKPVGRHTLFALVVIYCGLIAAFWHDLHQSKDTAAVITGSLWVLASSVTFSIYYLGTGRFVKQIGSTRLAGFAGAFASGYVLAHYFSQRTPTDLLAVPVNVWGWGLTLAIVSTVLPIWLAAKAVSKLGAGYTATIGTLGPGMTIVLGWIILNEPFSLLQLLGMSLVIGGVVWMGKKK